MFHVDSNVCPGLPGFIKKGGNRLCILISVLGPVYVEWRAFLYSLQTAMGNRREVKHYSSPGLAVLRGQTCRLGGSGVSGPVSRAPCQHIPGCPSVSSSPRQLPTPLTHTHMCWELSAENAPVEPSAIDPATPPRGRNRRA